jgi:hypothetical protein
MQPYEDPIISKYRELIKTAMPGVFKGYYQGDPFRIPKSNLPALLISKSQTSIGTLTNAEDTHQIGITMTVITDIRDERSDSTDMTPGIAQLYDIIEGRETTTYKLKAQSILNILRNNQVVDATYNLRTDLGTVTRADYGLTVGKRIPDGYATEGMVEFLATYSQLRN